MKAIAADLVDWARSTAEAHLGGLAPRWQHVQAVARLAEAVGEAFDRDRETLVAAALLHDIGYSPGLAVTGFHPLDGARFVRGQGHERLALLVAHHSGARNEARLRGLASFEKEFPLQDSELDRALTYCDLTTGPAGQRVRLEDRVAEIQSRYGPGHIVSRAIAAGVPEFERAIRETESLMAATGVSVSGSLAYPG
jgi:hypothetical protein